MNIIEEIIRLRDRMVVTKSRFGVVKPMITVKDMACDIKAANKIIARIANDGNNPEATVLLPDVVFSEAEVCAIYSKCWALNKDKLKCTGENECYQKQT